MNVLTPESGPATASIVADVFSLVGITPPKNFKDWTQSQLSIAYDYAIRLHLRASDNSGVRLSPRPKFL
jgi:hypothetical protein